jgi:cytochrome c1
MLIIGLGAAYGGYLYAKQRDKTDWVPSATGGNASRAPAIMIANGCVGCHTIPGVPGANGTAGPSLSGLANRGFIGGNLPNTPENLIAWIQHSRDIDPKTAMPNTNVSDQAARDIAAYLYDPIGGFSLF